MPGFGPTQPSHLQPGSMQALMGQALSSQLRGQQTLRQWGQQTQDPAQLLMLFMGAGTGSPYRNIAETVSGALKKLSIDDLLRVADELDVKVLEEASPGVIQILKRARGGAGGGKASLASLKAKLAERELLDRIVANSPDKSKAISEAGWLHDLTDPAQVREQFEHTTRSIQTILDLLENAPKNWP